MATQRSAFLINNLRPDLVLSNVFDVSEGAVRISASGISGTDYVKLQKQTSPAAGSFGAIWTDVIRQGQAVRLSQNNIEHIEMVTGIYRTVFVGAALDNVVVYMAEDQAKLDSKLMYTLPAYNPSFNGAVTGTGLSPALVNSRERRGHWAYDIGAKIFVWVESLLDTSTGAVTHEFYDAPGGNVVIPSTLIQQPVAYPSNERLFCETVTSAGAFDLNAFATGHAVKKITVLVDAGEFVLAGLSGSITVIAGETFTFEVSSNMGLFAANYTNPDPSFFTLTPVNVSGDSARVIVQACRVSPE